MYNTTKPYKKGILELIKETYDTKYVSVKDGIITKKFNYPEKDETDGIGTKGIYHWKLKTIEDAVIDALAMNLNDLALSGTIPYKSTDHIMLPEEDEDVIFRIIRKLTDECKKRDIAISSGETAIHDDMNGLEISLTVSGFIEKYKINRFKDGDVLIGIESDGLHSNGFTRIREIYGLIKRKEFTKPTLIYSDVLSEANRRFDINGMCHVTGGAFTKLKDILNRQDAIIHRNHKLNPNVIFYELYSKGVLDEEMYRTFNSGIGFILSCSGENVDNILDFISRFFNADTIGEVRKGENKIKIESMFSNRIVEF